MQAIVMCTDPRQDRGQVIMVGTSLLVSFGMIQGTVSAYGVIYDQVTGNVFYLVENVPDSVKVGDGVRVRTTISK